MGSAHSVNVPGGGTEGYHVLRVRHLSLQIMDLVMTNPHCYLGSGQFTRAKSWIGSVLWFHHIHREYETGKCNLNFKNCRSLKIFMNFQDQDNDTLKELLRAGIDKELPITVYSSKTQSIRRTTIVPSVTWGGQGLLGVSIRFCSFEGANENVWHVLVSIVYSRS